MSLQRLKRLKDQICSFTNKEEETLTEAIQNLKDTSVNFIFEIDSYEKLKEFSRLVNEDGRSHLNAKLINDIQINTGDQYWIENLNSMAIGTTQNPYQGVFDGQGYQIKNLRISYLDKSNANGAAKEVEDDIQLGLFGTIKNATIKNLTVTGACALGGARIRYLNSKIGGIVAQGENSIIENCLNQVTISNQTYATECYNVGGIIGKANGIQMYRCKNKGNINIVGYYTGGLIGYMEDSETQSKIIECCNYGNIDGWMSTGGLIGHIGQLISNDTTIEFITGKIISKEYIDVQVDINEDYDHEIVGISQRGPYHYEEENGTRHEYSVFDIEAKKPGESTIKLTIQDLKSPQEFKEEIINIKVVALNDSEQNTIIYNCYNIGNFSAHTKANKRNIKQAAGLFGENLVRDCFIKNCFTAGTTDKLPEEEQKNIDINGDGKLDEEDLYIGQAIHVNGRSNYIGNYNNIYFRKGVSRKPYNMDEDDHFEDIATEIRDSVMEHPYFSDLLNTDGKIFINANLFPCFKWEENYEISLDDIIENYIPFQNPYNETSYVLPYQFSADRKGGTVTLSGKLILPKAKVLNSNFIAGQTQLTHIIAPNCQLIDADAFRYSTAGSLYEKLTTLEIFGKSDKYLKWGYNPYTIFPNLPWSPDNLKILIIRNKEQALELTNSIVYRENGTLVCSLSSSDATIYVPYDLLETYTIPTDENEIPNNWGIFDTEGNRIGGPTFKSIEGKEYDLIINDENSTEEEKIQAQINKEETLNITGGFCL